MKQELNVLDSVPKEHIDCVKILLSDLACCDETKHREGVALRSNCKFISGSDANDGQRHRLQRFKDFKPTYGP